MGTVGDAFAAMDADKGFTGRIQIDSIHRAGHGAFAAAVAEFLLNYNAAPFALGIRTGRTGRHTWCRITGQADPRFKPRGEAARGPDANTGRIPGEAFVDQAGTGERAGVTADAALHSRCREDFHAILFMSVSRLNSGNSFDSCIHIIF